ncbi:MAG: hypothetical protein ACXABO_18590 [Promethearchaeota archaeon]|jgi:hypothetical protein
MKNEEKNALLAGYSKLTLFRFRLNSTHTTLILILTLICFFLFLNILVVEVIFNLSEFFFVDLPELQLEGRDPSQYLPIYFFPIITMIIFSGIFLFLSSYILKKLIGSNNSKNKTRLNESKKNKKKKLNQSDKIVSWLGFKLSNSQSIFIILLTGILVIIQLFIMESNLVRELCYIPIGPKTATGHEILSENIPIVIPAICIILFVYTFLITRRRKPASPSQRYIKKIGLFFFIVSFLVFLFSLIRLLCHLFLFTALAYSLGMPPHPTSSYQIIDFAIVIVILIVCLILMILSHFLKEKPYEEAKLKYELTWLHIKLTPERAIILLSLGIFALIYFGSLNLIELFLIGSYNYRYFFDNVFFFFEKVIHFTFIVLSVYTIDKVVKRHRLNYFINKIENSEEIICKWFKFNLNRLQAIIFFSLSIGFIVFNVYEQMMINVTIFNQRDQLIEITDIIRFLILTFFMFLILAVNIYTVNRTIPLIKSRKEN